MLLGKVAAIQPPQVNHGHEVVKVIVGSEQQIFTVHKALICTASPFFQTALASGFIEGAEQKVQLPEEDPQLFQLAYDWLYSGRVADGVTTYLKKEDVCSGDKFWWEVYKMGDRLMIDRLRVLALANIQAFFTTKKPLVPSTEFIADLYENGQQSSLEEWMLGYVMHWVHCSNPADWIPLIGAHMRFGQAFAQGSVEIMSWNNHNSAHDKIFAMVDGHPSPWRMAGVGEEPSGKKGGTQIRAKHLSEQDRNCWSHVPKLTDFRASSASQESRQRPETLASTTEAHKVREIAQSSPPPITLRHVADQKVQFDYEDWERMGSAFRLVKDKPSAPRSTVCEQQPGPSCTEYTPRWITSAVSERSHVGPGMCPLLKI